MNTSHRTTIRNAKEAIEAGINEVDDIVVLTGDARTDVIAALKRFEKRGMGKFVVGRKGHPSRFELFAETFVAPAPVAAPVAPAPVVSRQEIEQAVNLLRQYILDMNTGIMSTSKPKHKSGTFAKTGT